MCDVLNFKSNCCRWVCSVVGCLELALYVIALVLTIVVGDFTQRCPVRQGVEGSLLHVAHQLLQGHGLTHVALQLQLAAHESHGGLQAT